MSGKIDVSDASGKVRRFSFPDEPDDVIEVFCPDNPAMAAHVQAAVDAIIAEGYVEIGGEPSPVSG